MNFEQKYLKYRKKYIDLKNKMINSQLAGNDRFPGSVVKKQVIDGVNIHPIKQRINIDPEINQNIKNIKLMKKILRNLHVTNNDNYASLLALSTNLRLESELMLSTTFAGSPMSPENIVLVYV
jgi:hypothetical protein